MTASYLPPKATIEQSCQWLARNTGELWTLPRLLEHFLTPWLWLDYQEGHPELFGNRVEGFLAPVSFAGDLQRLSVDCHDVVLTMTCTPDGRRFSLCPGVEYPVDDLRFLREDIQRLAGKFSATAAAPSGAPEKAATEVTPTGIPKEEILAVDWPLFGQFNQESLSAALSDVPEWLKPARTARGSPGKASALWNPAKLADCIVSKKYANQKAAGSFIGKYFADWLPEWEKLQEYR